MHSLNNMSIRAKIAAGASLAVLGFSAAVGVSPLEARAAAPSAYGPIDPYGSWSMDYVLVGLSEIDRSKLDPLVVARGGYIAGGGITGEGYLRIRFDNVPTDQIPRLSEIAEAAYGTTNVKGDLGNAIRDGWSEVKLSDLAGVEPQPRTCSTLYAMKRPLPHRGLSVPE